MPRNLILLLLFYCTASYAQPKKRADSFFGIHFDFHAGKGNTEIGRTFTRELIDSFFTIVHPDFVQVDCKGHPGYSSYPTRVGNHPEGIQKDILKLWQEEAARHQVALYVHYSGIMDQKAASDHPSWARIDAMGKHDNEKVGYYSGYVDSLMIPQFKEIADYGVNGAWVDGDCWATQPDYSAAMLEQYKKETGQDAPVSDKDPRYGAWIEFNRKAFRQYVRHYVDAIHQYKPGFQITSNWSFSSLMPEPVDVGVDFLSGDVAGQNGVYNAAFQARCMALQGKPWDLMSWSFTYDFGAGGIKGPKSLVQLEQEAAEVIMMGGGFQAYYTQHTDGSIKPWYFSQMAALGKFVRDRQPFCQDAASIPQIGLWYSTYSKRNQTNQIYGWSVPNVEGILSLLLDGQHAVDILMDHQLPQRMKDYPVIVIPEWTGLDPALQQQALDYTAAGGNLIIIGAEAVKPFEQALGVAAEKDPLETVTYFGWNRQVAGAKTRILPVKALKGTEAIGDFLSTDDFRFASGNPIVTIRSYGKGKIAGVYADLSAVYDQYRAPLYVQLLSDLLQQMGPEKLVQVKGSSKLHTSIMKKDNAWMIHLVNSGGEHFNRKVYAYEQLPQSLPVAISLSCAKKVKQVLLQPQNKPLGFTQQNGRLSVKVPPVSVHSIVQLIFH
jgi:hypothetical protein